MSQEDMNEVKLEEIKNLIIPNVNDKDKNKESSSLLDEKENAHYLIFLLFQNQNVIEVNAFSVVIANVKRITK